MARLAGAVRSRQFAWGVIVTGALFLLAAALVVWARQHTLAPVGRIMTQTRVSRVGLTIPNPTATQSKRAEARLQAPRVYVPQEAVIESIRTSLLNLPRTVASAETVEAVDATIAAQFSLTQRQLEALKAVTFEGEPSRAWTNRVTALVELLYQVPFLDAQTWQRETQRGGELELRGPVTQRIRGTLAVNLDSAPELTSAAASMVEKAGFKDELAEVVLSRLIIDPRVTFQFDEAATLELQAIAEAAVPEEMLKIPEGTVIYKRGDRLSPQQAELDRAERRWFAATIEFWPRVLHTMGLGGAAGLMVIALAAYLGIFNERIRQRAARMVCVAVLVGGAVAGAVIGSVFNPGFAALISLAPVLFVAVIMVIAYDQRTALAVASLAGLLVCLALDLRIGSFLVMIAGIGAAVFELPEIRDRSTIVRMGVMVGLFSGAGTLLVGLTEAFLGAPLVTQVAIDALLACFAGLFVAGLTMFILPWVERVFDIATGMTLIELRDPRQALLRELQLKAPGTYNHSLTVASIAEAASDAIGANALLTYVGALYHDIGKMNKPEYFVENQFGGPNKHDKLSPAMSLLVIVGHVKDGVEMAKAWDLPRPLIHFIEAHHGTTLVEFFYRRAKDQAEQAAREDGPETPVPTEFDFRYPGPKPQTREVAIVMLADAVESATRTLAEPTPARIDALVRSLANKRLLDGQFDEANLTLREISAIVESISKSVASIYHGRIAYPGGETKAPDTRTRDATPPPTSERKTG